MRHIGRTIKRFTWLYKYGISLLTPDNTLFTPGRLRKHVNNTRSSRDNEDNRYNLQRKGGQETSAGRTAKRISDTDKGANRRNARYKRR